MCSPNRSRYPFAAVLIVALAWTADAAQPEQAPAPRLKTVSVSTLPSGAIARIGHPRLRLPGAVINVVFAPSGTTFLSTGDPAAASKSFERVLILWDATTGRELRRFKGHQGGVEAAAFSSDGKKVATGSIDGTVRLWDIATGNELRQFKGHANAVLAVAYSPDQRRIASSGKDETVRIWDAETARELRQLPGKKSQGTSNLRFSPDGKHLATVGADSAIRFWDPETGQELNKLTGPTRDTLSLDFSTDGKQLAAIGEEGEVSVWDLEQDNVRRRFTAHKAVGACVRFSPDGSLLATGGSDGSIRYWDAATHKLLRSSSGHPGSLSEISFSADGSILASAGHDGTVRIWDVATGLELPQSGGQGSRVALSPDGKTLATVGHDPMIRIWDGATARETRAIPVTPRPLAIGFTPDGGELVLTADSNELQNWDVASGKQLWRSEIGKGTPLSRFTIGSRGRIAATAGGKVGRLWNLETKSPAAGSAPFELAVSRIGGVWSMALSPNEDRIAVSGADGKVHVWDIAGGTELFAVPGQAGPIATAVAWSRDGRTLATTTSSGLHLWEVASGHERRAPIMPQISCWSVAISPDCRIAAVGCNSGLVQLYELQTGKLLSSRTGHSAAVSYLAFSNDGRTLVSAGADVTLPVQGAADRTYIGDGTVIIWGVAALLGQMPDEPKPAVDEIESLWEALAGGDAIKAAAAVWKLSSVPDLALPLLKSRLPKATSGRENERVAKLIVDLDDDSFDVREKATQDLIRLGTISAQSVRQALATTKSREVRRRAGEIVAKLGSASGGNAEETLAARGVEVLQRIDSTASRELLRGWAEEPAQNILTREARSALGLIGK